MFIRKIRFVDETNPKATDADFVWLFSYDKRVMAIKSGGCFHLSSSRPSELRFNDNLESDEFGFEFETSEVNQKLSEFLKELGL